MPEFTKPATGTFCWVELQTTDVDAARSFYASIFGWTITDVPGPVPYGIAGLDGRMTAGLMTLPEPLRSSGASARWLSYVAVEDVETSTVRAVELGATVLVPPSRVGSATLSVLRDPTDAVIALWHAAEPMGTTICGELGSFGWHDLISADLDRARRFYTSLFGWSAESVPLPNVGYLLLRRAGLDVGGIMLLPDSGPLMPAGWGVYFVVADADAVFRKSVALGARVILPLTDMPTVGRFGFLSDPQGAHFAVIRLEPRAA